MIKRRTAILTLLLLIGVFMVPILVPVWAGDPPPIETIRNFNNKIEVTFNQTDGTPTTVKIDGSLVPPGKAWICAGTPPVGASPDGSYTFHYDPVQPPYGFECFEAKNAGPRSSGCPVFANPTYYLYGGDAYRR